MKSSLKTACLLGASSLVLAACGGGGGSSGTYNPPAVVVTSVPGQLGTSFEQIFNKDANADATDPVPDNAVVAISFTDDPIQLP